MQFLLGHVSVQTTERYLGCKQRLRDAVNDSIGIGPEAVQPRCWPTCRDRSANQFGTILDIDRTDDPIRACASYWKRPEDVPTLSELARAQAPWRSRAS